MTKQNTTLVLKLIINILVLRFFVIVATVLPGQVGWELREAVGKEHWDKMRRARGQWQ